MKYLGKLVRITDSTSPLCGEYGIIRGFDGESYYIFTDCGKVELGREQFSI